MCASNGQMEALPSRRGRTAKDPSAHTCFPTAACSPDMLSQARLEVLLTLLHVTTKDEATICCEWTGYMACQGRGLSVCVLTLPSFFSSTRVRSDNSSLPC